MVCVECRIKKHSWCASMRADAPGGIEKTWCDCQHLQGLVNWVGLELEGRERQTEEPSGEGEQEGTG